MVRCAKFLILAPYLKHQNSLIPSHCQRVRRRKRRARKRRLRKLLLLKFWIPQGLLRYLLRQRTAQSMRVLYLLVFRPLYRRTVLGRLQLRNLVSRVFLQPWIHRLKVAHRSRVRGQRLRSGLGLRGKLRKISLTHPQLRDGDRIFSSPSHCLLVSFISIRSDLAVEICVETWKC